MGVSGASVVRGKTECGRQGSECGGDVEGVAKSDFFTWIVLAKN